MISVNQERCIHWKHRQRWKSFYRKRPDSKRADRRWVSPLRTQEFQKRRSMQRKNLRQILMSNRKDIPARANRSDIIDIYCSYTAQYNDHFSKCKRMSHFYSFFSVSNTKWTARPKTERISQWHDSPSLKHSPLLPPLLPPGIPLFKLMTDVFQVICIQME